ncbi:MAG: helix-turn-helix domain-containing protein [Planctomycetes bacterium]|nr:helix-turn-helix domain-containing protein [Planctomycetota bacterium]
MKPQEIKLLANLAHRIKELRLQKGFTVKEAADKSGFSLRFYHYLEAGTANVSITKLSGVAEALNISLYELFRQNVHNSIALLGLRGGGKSTIGHKLAKVLKCKFIELDNHIERTAALPLSKIFTLHGEDYYRKLEGQCLNKILTKRERQVIELPGGIIKNESAFDLARKLCTTVWLKARPEDHMNRVYLQGDTRPMANRKNAMDELKQILSDREPFYGLADITVDTSTHSIKETVEILANELSKTNSRRNSLQH